MVGLDIRHVSYLYPILAFLILPAAAVSQEVAANRHPVWGPDGRIYFHSDRAGVEAIYSMRADGTDQRRFANSVGAARSIAWSPTGSRAVFMARTGENFDLYETDREGSAVAPFVVRPGEDWDPVWSPDGSSVVWMATTEDGDHELFLIDADGGTPRRMTDHPGMDAYPDWDPDGGALVFIRRATDNDIYEMRPDGSNLRNLTRHSAEDNGPRVSPDGRHIAFFSNRAGNFEIYVMSRDGGEPTRLTRDEGGDFYPTWSPDGAWIAFESDRSGTPQIFRMRPDGSELRQLTGGPTKASQTHYESIGWTPDGAALTVSAGGDVYVLPLSAGPAQRLTGASERDIHASWAPDGSAFVFGSYGDGDAEIFVAAHDGSGPRPLTNDEADNSAPAWSPDGQRIAFMRKGGDHWQLWTMKADGSEARRLTRSTGNDFNPRWSPDGSWLVFESSRHGGDQDEIYRIRPDGSGERRLTNTPGNDIYPDWSADGERIAYCTIEKGRAFVYQIPAGGGEPKLLVEDACLPAWSPDGNRIAFVSVARGQPERLWVAAPDGSEAIEVEGLDGRPVVEASETADVGSGGDAATVDTGSAAGDKPRVAILIYDGVQIIDHAAPWEVLGQYSLNEVFTVAKDTTAVTTFMGMRVLPSYGFGDHPAPDVVVIPGGDAGDARADPEVIEWIRRHAGESRYVLGICSGVMLLAEADLLEGRRATTFYNLLDDLADEHPGATVVEDELVVEDGKYVTTTGTGIEGALRVLELLHGEPWTRVVKLNMEFQPLPDSARSPRVRLADMNLPTAIYGDFPWREAELTFYEGDESRWTMAWRFDGGDIGALAAALATSLRVEGWTTLGNEADQVAPATDAWTSDWLLTGRDGEPWTGQVALRRTDDERLELKVAVSS